MELHPQITPELADWLQHQPLCFVATAPLNQRGHINLSPRGLDSLRILDPKRVAILDLTGSGNETAAHLNENGRITVMFCAFDDPPRILRLYGQGKVILPEGENWQALRSLFATGIPGVRQIFDIEVTRVQTSCGFGVPLMTFESQRNTLLRWAENKGETGIRDYQQAKNALSIDGLPAPR
jgi:hypothetical protein